MALLALLLASAAGAVTLSAVGDIRLDGPIQQIAKEGADAPSRAIKHLLDADIVFGNLETPVTTRGTKFAKTWNFRSRPENLKILTAAGFNLLNIANNHVWDYGEQGFLDTLKHLEKGRWRYVGGGRDRDEAERVTLLRFPELTVGFLGMTSTNPKEGWAKPGKPGVMYSDFTRVRDAVARAKKRCDVLVVSFHGGTELAPEPNDIQKSVSRAAIDGGADLFLGHHPHVLQPVELYKGKPIVHSLGNFFFVSPSTATRPTAVVRAELSKEGVKSLEIVPVDGNWGRPKPADPVMAAEIRGVMNAYGAFEEASGLIRWSPAGPTVPAGGSEGP